MLMKNVLKEVFNTFKPALLAMAVIFPPVVVMTLLGMI